MGFLQVFFKTFMTLYYPFWGNLGNTLILMCQVSEVMRRALQARLFYVIYYYFILLIIPFRKFRHHTDAPGVRSCATSFAGTFILFYLFCILYTLLSLSGNLGCLTWGDGVDHLVECRTRDPKTGSLNPTCVRSTR